MFFNRYTIIAITAVLMVSFYVNATEKEDFIKKLESSHNKEKNIDKLFKDTPKMSLLSKKDLNNIFINATNSGHHRIIQKFFKSENQMFLNQISDGTFMEAINTAFNSITHSEKTKTIRNSFYILQEFLKPANDSILKNLEKKIDGFSSHFDFILILAVGNNNVAIIDELFNNKYFLKKIDKTTFALCLKNAAEDDNRPLVLKFITNKVFTDKLKRKDFNIAAKCAKTKEIKELIKQYTPKKKFIFF